MNSTVEKYIVFLLSPFLSIPLFLKDVYYRKEKNFLLIAFIFGFLSYAYLPTVTNDKAYYYLLFQKFEFFDFKELLFFLADKPDFIFYTLIFFFAKLGISIQFLFFFLTSFTVWVWFNSFKEISQKVNLINKEYFLFFLLILFSFSLDHLLSGTRNYFAFSFLLLGFFRGIVNNHTKSGLLYVILAVLTHFSSFIFLPVYIILVLYPEKYVWYKIIFIISFVFLLLPRDFLLNVAINLDLPDVFRYKVEGYLDETDFVENSLKVGNFNNYLRIFFYSLWTYFAWFYLFLTFKRKSMLRNLTLITFAISNLFYSAPGTYTRYLLIPQIFFILLLIYEYSEHRNLLKFSRILLIIFLLNFFGNVYGQREQYSKSYWNLYSLTSASIFMKDKITTQDFIK